MNKDHAGELSLYLRAFNGVPASAASAPRIVDMSLDGMEIQSASGAHTVAIRPPLANWGASRVKLVEMAGEALRKLGLSDIKIDVFSPPAGLDLVPFLGILLYFFCAATRAFVQPGTAAWDALDDVFPGGADGYRWLIKAMFVPVVAIHVTEAWWMSTTRLAKHRVEGAWVWWLWNAAVFFEGYTAFRRFDGLVAKEKARKEGLKH
jgi:hypothetical protein